MPALSVVIPAHNEERTLPRLLTRLLAEDTHHDLEIVVVANGCSDGTAEAARRFGDRVTVLDLEIGNKVAALNAGDAAAVTHPRAYVDADTEVSAAALLSLASHLTQAPGPLTAAPRMLINLRGASIVSRMYHQIWSRTAYVREGPIGCGVYALNAAARAQFGAFPAVIADDVYVERMAGPDRWIDPNHTFTFYAPRTRQALLSRLTRATLGNLQLEVEFGFKAGTGSPRFLLTAVAKRPWLWPAFVVYVGLRQGAERRAQKRLASGEYEWSRDESTRH